MLAACRSTGSFSMSMLDGMADSASSPGSSSEAVSEGVSECEGQRTDVGLFTDLLAMMEPDAAATLISDAYQCFSLLVTRFEQGLELDDMCEDIEELRDRMAQWLGSREDPLPDRGLPDTP